MSVSAMSMIGCWSRSASAPGGGKAWRVSSGRCSARRRCVQAGTSRGLRGCARAAEKYGTFSDSAALIREERDARMIVLDASVAAKAYVEEVGSDEATAVLACEEKLLAPELIRVEVAAALCRRVRRGELEAEERARCEHWLGRLQKGCSR